MGLRSSTRRRRREFRDQHETVLVDDKGPGLVHGADHAQDARRLRVWKARTGRCVVVGTEVRRHAAQPQQLFELRGPGRRLHHLDDELGEVEVGARPVDERQAGARVRPESGPFSTDQGGGQVAAQDVRGGLGQLLLVKVGRQLSAHQFASHAVAEVLHHGSQTGRPALGDQDVVDQPGVPAGRIIPANGASSFIGVDTRDASYSSRSSDASVSSGRSTSPTAQPRRSRTTGGCSPQRRHPPFDARVRVVDGRLLGERCLAHLPELLGHLGSSRNSAKPASTASGRRPMAHPIPLKTAWYHAQATDAGRSSSNAEP